MSRSVCTRQATSGTRGDIAGAAWTTDAEFDAITALFEAPSLEEGFNVIRHARA